MNKITIEARINELSLSHAIAEVAEKLITKFGPIAARVEMPRNDWAQTYIEGARDDIRLVKVEDGAYGNLFLTYEPRPDKGMSYAQAKLSYSSKKLEIMPGDALLKFDRDGRLTLMIPHFEDDDEYSPAIWLAQGIALLLKDPIHSQALDDLIAEAHGEGQILN